MEKKMTRGEAARLARRIGCSGAHQNDDGQWMPCGSHDELIRISNAAEGKSEEPPCIGCDGKADRKKRGAGPKKRWEKLRESGILGIDTLEGGGLVSGGKSAGFPTPTRRVRLYDAVKAQYGLYTKALNPRQQEIYDDLEKVVEDYGQFDLGTGPDGAHYMPASKNPFIEEGLVCSNCAFWKGPSSCEIVEGELEPNAICKFWVIDGDRIVASEKQQELGELLEKRLGGRIGRRVPKPEAVDLNAEDGDGDGFLQDGTTAERPAGVNADMLRRAVSAGRIAVRRDDVDRSEAGGAGKEGVLRNLLPKRVGRGKTKVANKDKIKVPDKQEVSDAYNNAVKKILEKRGISKIESQEHARILIRKEFPNADVSNLELRFDANGQPNSRDLGSIYGFLLAADHIPQDSELRENLKYIDNNSRFINRVLGVRTMEVSGATAYGWEQPAITVGLRNNPDVDKGTTISGAIKKLFNNNNPIEKRFSDEVHSFMVAAHEMGHAIHDQRKYYDEIGYKSSQNLQEFLNITDEEMADLVEIMKQEIPRIRQLMNTQFRNLNESNVDNIFLMIKSDKKMSDDQLASLVKHILVRELYSDAASGRKWADDLEQIAKSDSEYVLTGISDYAKEVDAAEQKHIAEGWAEWYSLLGLFDFAQIERFIPGSDKNRKKRQSESVAELMQWMFKGSA